MSAPRAYLLFFFFGKTLYLNPARTFQNITEKQGNTKQSSLNYIQKISIFTTNV